MKTNKTDYERITDFGNLYKAYLKSKSGSGFSKSKQKFQTVALDGIYQLKRKLETKTYGVSKYNEFIIHEPKERIIKSGSFSDKIVQHSLCDNVLIPILKNDFIETNYAGQVGKGTLYGLNCLKHQMQMAYNEYGYNCWIIKGDIHKFFYSINHDILKDILGYFIEDKDVYWLCEKFIDSTEDPGIALGNQVNQVYALLFLSCLDHLMTGDLGIKFHGRYMDDFYGIVEDKNYAKWCLYVINEFVHTLNLELNGKTQIMPFKNGIKFCGFHTYVTPNGKVIRKLKNDNKRNAKTKFKKMIKLVKNGRLSEEKFYESYNAWKNHISHGNCIKLGYEMDKYINGLLYS